MNLPLDSIVQWITILGALLTLTSYLLKHMIVSPLQTAITTLKDAVNELKKMLEKVEDVQQDIDKRLVAVEQSAKSAHHRLGRLEGEK
jgi:biopolymer transport protein ExbB/TolQ